MSLYFHNMIWMKLSYLGSMCESRLYDTTCFLLGVSSLFQHDKLPLLGLGSNSASLSSGFCVCRPRQYDAICWKLDLIPGFFIFSWLIVWAVESINMSGVLQGEGDSDSRL